MIAGKASLTILAIIYALGTAVAFGTIAETWGVKHWWGYPIVLLPAMLWPIAVTIHSTSCLYEGGGAQKSSICRGPQPSTPEPFIN